MDRLAHDAYGKKSGINYSTLESDSKDAKEEIENLQTDHARNHETEEGRKSENSHCRWWRSTRKSPSDLGALNTRIKKIKKYIKNT